MKNAFFSWIYFLFLLGFSVQSCTEHSTSKNDDLAKEEIIPLYKIPIENPISDIERANFIRQCQLFYDTVLNVSGFNGGIIVAKNGQVVFEKYRGSINLDHKDSISENTPLHIASVTKTFTAMAILKLQEQGKLNINDSLAKYFPAFNYPGITIKTLLEHRSGLPNYLYFMDAMGWNKDSIVQNKDVLKFIIDKKNLATDVSLPDTKFTYNNTNYILLALIIEKVSGKTYPEFMKKNIFLPLEMTNTFVHCKNDTIKRSKTFDWKGREILDSYLDQTYGDKNIYTTPRDLLKWDRALSHNVFLSSASLAAAYRPYSNERPGIKNYGFGWRMNIYSEEKKVIFHNGWWHGNNATFIRLLKEDATIILISNRYARSVYDAKKLINIFGNYFDEAGDDDESTRLSAIPETFTEEEKFLKAGEKNDRFSDRHKKDSKVDIKSEQFSDLNKKEE